MNLLTQKVGSGISRAAANRNNPLHWISGGHTHVYPRCDNDESAPVTPSAGVAASSDAGIVSVASSIDDSALKGTPRSPGHVTHGKASPFQEFASRQMAVLVCRIPCSKHAFAGMVRRMLLMMKHLSSSLLSSFVSTGLHH